MEALLEETNAMSATFGCTGLEYVSCAGLRVIMELAGRLQAPRVDTVLSER